MLQQICKGAKRIELFSAPSSSVQWISDGGAFYPLYNLPEMREENVFALFDIPEKKQDKIRFEYKSQLPEAICFGDTAEAENVLELGYISICARGRALRPLKTSHGMIYINEKYLKPFADAENGVQLYERYTPGGEVYIAVKEGFLLTGIILPDDIVTEDFVEALKVIYELSALSAENKGLCSVYAMDKTPEVPEMPEADEDPAGAVDETVDDVDPNGCDDETDELQVDLFEEEGDLYEES